jgi:hypothetical protein
VVKTARGDSRGVSRISKYAIGAAMRLAHPRANEKGLIAASVQISQRTVMLGSPAESF